MTGFSDRVSRALGILAPFGPRAIADGPLGPLTTYRVGGSAAIRVTVAAEAELDVVADAVSGDLPVLVVGRGSNLLVADRGFPGLALMLDPDVFGRVDIDGADVGAGAAVALPALARQSVEAGLTGLEWAVGVPGSVGGAVRMNAGGHGSDMAHTLAGARLYDLDARSARSVGVAELDYAYRHSAVGSRHVVIQGRFTLSAGDRNAGRETIREIVRWRREHQPGGQNAGSVFTNPPGDSAGRLIEEAGLKGHRIGSAMVSAKHANFIQADPGGSADDVRALIAFVAGQVRSRLGADLRPEVRLVGFDPTPPAASKPGGQVEV